MSENKTTATTEDTTPTGPMLTLDPADQSPLETYKLMIGAIVPRPIAFVSSINEQGVRNLAPFSLFTMASYNPPVVCFTPMFRDTARSGLPPAKDTLRNIAATREFVVNIVSEGFVAQMNACSAELPPEVDEFTVSGLTPLASDRVRPPRVAESHVQMECRLLQIVTVSERPLGGSLVLGEVVRFHVRESIFNNFHIDPDKLRAVGRMGGPTYVRTLDRFDLARPK